MSGKKFEYESAAVASGNADDGAWWSGEAAGATGDAASSCAPGLDAGASPPFVRFVRGADGFRARFLAPAMSAEDGTGIGVGSGLGLGLGLG